ncbi:hypothetical protein B7P34_24110 [Streptosporangium nondiastaticum]|uniref:Gram-positive cocci surface proteins LPxTG domain-containing protein n=2 Tax=Actinomycetes TaxID=1760 RepID=A0A9X7JM67_9ACTN|nr:MULTISPECIES: hypothetical protein [Actinomycetes]PSJ26172.1 hypothetical protein B7P34_24110 [Streptosporangium nondiastaticum]WKU45006.1 hypothetical protein Q3V23_13515 [Streptomyces sp. VNUA116]
MPKPRALVLGATALAIFSTAAPAPAHQAAGPEPVRPRCAAPGTPDFPIAAELSGGPETYERGAGPRTWRLELRNRSAAECRAVHPVAVLADRGRALRPGDIRLDFYDAGAGRWRPVRFERTDEAENVGVFDGTAPDAGRADRAAARPAAAPAFGGFSVPAHGSVPVRVRLAFAAGAPEGPVTANVTAVQRRGDDGEWVGESNDYAFGIGTTPDRTSAPAKRGADDGEQPLLADTGSQRPLLAIAAAAGALLLAGASLIVGARRSGR